MSAVVDLHLHTLASDGRLSPTELVRLAASQGLKAIAVTDHDTTDGLAEAFEAARRFPGLRIIPGIELSADVPGDEVHVLGYFINPEDAELQAELVRFREGRVDRAKTMVEKLGQLGIHVEWERVQHFAGDGAVGRPHIAMALVEAGYCQEPKDAFPEYLGRNGLAYVERVKLTPAEAVGMIRRAGGAAVLAHPAYMNDMESGIASLSGIGLAGIEVHYAKYREDTIRQLARIARQYELIPCGGSDYHGMGNSDECLPGENGPALETVDRLEEVAVAGR
ncbi:MAG: PHP domain-containing protein [Chloroflexi bacterium]|nr:PHP domain-containing protein [Chloroflexota bacterium]MYE40760.1 PHP domain-containing protein [Chloroflexota bacterium]